MEKSATKDMKKEIQNVADNVNELTEGALDIDTRHIAPKNAVSSLSMAKQDTLRFTYGAAEATSPLAKILTVNDKVAIGGYGSQMKGSIRTGRDSCQTLLAESERQRRSDLQKKLVISQKNMMRGRFGDLIESPTRSPLQRSNSSVATSHHNIQQYDDQEILKLGEEEDDDEFWDEHGEFLDTYNDQVGINESDWRQLFDAEELHRAYQQSIIGFKDVKIEVNKSKKKKPTIAQRIARDDSYDNEDDDSADGDSVDDLDKSQLERQVYMQKEAVIEKAMCTKDFAQSNFLREVKVMIRKIR